LVAAAPIPAQSGRPSRSPKSSPANRRSTNMSPKIGSVTTSATSQISPKCVTTILAGTLQSPWTKPSSRLSKRIPHGCSNPPSFKWSAYRSSCVDPVNNFMRCIILNRHYPPSLGITGASASELADYLHHHGVEVHVVTVGGNYEGGVRAGPASTVVKIHQVRSWYNGKNKLLRLMASLLEGRRMVAKAASLGIAPVIALTDPPLLNYWMARLGRRAGIPWIYWSMDIYPEAFVSAGLTKMEGRIYRYFKRGCQASLPSGKHTIGAA